MWDVAVTPQGSLCPLKEQGWVVTGAGGNGELVFFPPWCRFGWPSSSCAGAAHSLLGC